MLDMRSWAIGFAVIFATGSSHAVPPDVLQRALKAKSVNEAMAVLGVQAPEEGKRVLLDVPDISDSGSKVLVKVTSRIAGTDWIAVLVDRNLTPFVKDEEFSPGADRSLSLTVDLAQSSRVRVLVRASGKFYQVSRDVKVATDGCVKL